MQQNPPFNGGLCLQFERLAIAGLLIMRGLQVAEWAIYDGPKIFHPLVFAYRYKRGVQKGHHFIWNLMRQPHTIPLSTSVISYMDANYFVYCLSLQLACQTAKRRNNRFRLPKRSYSPLRPQYR